MVEYFKVFVAFEDDDSEKMSYTTFDSNDKVIILAAVACFTWRSGSVFRAR